MLSQRFRAGCAIALAAFASFATFSSASAQSHNQDRLPMFGDMTYEEKLGFLGEFSGEEIFGLGTAEYKRASFEESQKHPCEIVVDFDVEAGAGVNNTWPDGVVPYAFNANVSATNRNRAIAAMNEISAIAPVFFIPRTTETAFIVYNNSTVNSSQVGRTGGAQTINMVSWSFRFIIVHEIMHALGFWHEQQRPDRNGFVQINFGNVQPGTTGNFTIPGGTFNIGTYDFGSVMHYGQCDFTVCGVCNSACRTITVLPPNTGQQGLIGQRSELSTGDIESINVLYGGGTTALPIVDDFESGTIDDTVWFAGNGAAITTQGIAEPSGVRSVNLASTQLLRLLFADATLLDSINVSYAWQRRGGGDSPETNDDLLVEYFNNVGQWTLIARHLGSGPDMTTYMSESFDLPADAQHEDFRVRFTNTSMVGGGFDDYFLDDVSVTASPALPGSFSTLLPADGATEVANSPLFTWEAAAATTSYRLLVDNNSDFSSPSLDFVTPVTSFSNPGFNIGDGDYFWKVLATNMNGETTSSPDPSIFTVGLPQEACLGDCDESGTVDFNDLVAMLFAFGPAGGPGDLCDSNESGTVDFNDLVATLFLFGPCP